MRKSIFLSSLICLTLAISGCNSNVSNQEESPVIEEHKIPGIVQSGVEMDETGTLKYIENATIEAGTGQDIRIINDRFVVSNFTYDATTKQSILVLKTLSLESGEVVKEASFEGLTRTNIQVCNDRIVLNDVENGNIYVLNEDLECLEEHSVMSCNNIYVNQALTEAYCFTSEEGLHVVNLESGQEDVLLKDTNSLYVSVYNENAISMKYVDEISGFECAAGLNLETGEIEKLEIPNSFSGVEYNAGTWLAQINGTEASYLIGTQKEPYKYDAGDYSTLPSLLGNKMHVVFREYLTDGSQVWSAYNTDGTFCSEFQLSAGFTSAGNKPVWSEAANGYFFTLMNEEYQDQLFFWDFSVEAEGEDLALSDYYEKEELGGEVLPQEIYEDAKALGEKYGIVIRIADQCETDYGEQYAVQELDETAVKKGLEALEDAMKSFPDNFFEQIYFGSHRNLEISLVGEIDYHEPIEGHDPIAFVSMDNNEITMVLNINTAKDLLEGNFYHEVSHMVDRKLAYIAQYKAGALYSEEQWEELNPSNFPGYYGEYGNLPEEYYDSSFGAYFLDFYSMTKPGEDRARVLEYAMMGHKAMFDREHYEGRYKKLEYYSACIRDAFDTTGWPEQTKWEATLEAAK